MFVAKREGVRMSEFYKQTNSFLLRRDKDGHQGKLNCFKSTTSIDILLPVYACSYVKIKRTKTKNIFSDTVCKLWDIYRKRDKNVAPENIYAEISYKTGLDKALVTSFIEGYTSKRDVNTGIIDDGEDEIDRSYLFYDFISEKWLSGYLSSSLYAFYSEFDRINKNEESVYFTVNEPPGIKYGPFYQISDNSKKYFSENIPEPDKESLRKILRRNEYIINREMPVPVYLACRCFIPDGDPHSLHIEYPWPNGDLIFPQKLEEFINNNDENEYIADALFEMKSKAKKTSFFLTKQKKKNYEEKISNRYNGIENYDKLFLSLSVLEEHLDIYEKLKKDGSVDEQKAERSELAYLCHTAFENLFVASYNKRNSNEQKPDILNDFFDESTTDTNKKILIQKMFEKSGFFRGDADPDKRNDAIEFLRTVKNINSSYQRTYVPAINEIFLAVLAAAYEDPDSVPLWEAACDPICYDFPKIMKKSLTERNEGAAHKNKNEINDKFIPSDVEIIKRCQMADRFTAYLVAPYNDKAPNSNETDDDIVNWENKVPQEISKYKYLSSRSSNIMRDRAKEVVKDYLGYQHTYFVDAYILVVDMISELLAPIYQSSDFSYIRSVLYNDNSDINFRLESKIVVQRILAKYGIREDWQMTPNVKKFLSKREVNIEKESPGLIFYVFVVLCDHKNPAYLKKILREIPELIGIIDKCTVERAHDGQEEFDKQDIEGIHLQLLAAADKVCRILEE